MKNLINSSKDILNMKNLINSSKDILEGENLKEEQFMRLDSKSIKVDMFTAARELTAIYNLQKNGNDYDREELRALIKKLQKIGKAAKTFKDRDSLPKNYQYKY